MTRPVVNCWEDGAEHGHPDTTCMLLDGHDGDHDWTPDDCISVTFAPASED